MDDIPLDASVVCYSVDERDRIVSVGGGFAAFAEANGAPDLPGRCLGRSLYAFMGGPEVVAFHQDLMRRIRAAGAVKDLPFRCDAPGERRFMRLSAVARPDGSVHFECRVERVEPRAEPLPHGAPTGPRRFVRQCAWCNRIEAGTWMELEVAIAHLRLLDDVESLRFSHGICPTCLATTAGLSDGGDPPVLGS